MSKSGFSPRINACASASAAVAAAAAAASASDIGKRAIHNMCAVSINTSQPMPAPCSVDVWMNVRTTFVFEHITSTSSDNIDFAHAWVCVIVHEYVPVRAQNSCTP
eukprot:scpid67662/ scgid23361/ 